MIKDKKKKVLLKKESVFDSYIKQCMGDAYNNCSRRQASSHTKIFAELNRGFGSTSGIDNAIYSSIDLATTQKIISLARYLLATNGQSLPGILAWQYNHPLPYEDGITENVYHNIFYVFIHFKIVSGICVFVYAPVLP